MQGSDFFRILYEDKAPEDHLLLWKASNKRSVWLTDIDASVDQAIQKNPNDVYFGVGLRKPPSDIKPVKRDAQWKRGGIEDIIALPGFFVDIDIHSDNPKIHKKSDLPPTVEAAMGLVTGRGFDPTIVIHSGYGLHAYWLFKEIWRLESEREREAASALSYRLQTTIRHYAQQQHWTIDSTFNLDRILRVPGTFNCKNGKPIKVEVLWQQEDSRYNPEDLEDFLLPLVDYEAPSVCEVRKCPPSEGPHTAQRTAQISREARKKAPAFVFDPNAKVNPDELMQLQQVNDPWFTMTWEKNRDEEFLQSKSRDTSPSAYDLALCNMAVQCGWNDQEIINLMIAFRRKHGFDLKLKNQQYYTRTILVARERFDEAKVSATTTTASILSKGENADTETAKEARLAAISQILGIEITRILKYVGDSPFYVFQRPGGDTKKDLYIKSTEDLLNYHRFRIAYFNATNQVFKMSVKEYPKFIELVGLQLEEIYTSHEAFLSDRIEGWLLEYVTTRQPDAEFNSSVINEKPLFLGDQWHVYADNFYKWAATQKGFREAKKTLLAQLRIFGASAHRVNYTTHAGTRSQRHYYKLPESFTATCAMYGGKDEDDDERR